MGKFSRYADWARPSREMLEARNGYFEIASVPILLVLTLTPRGLAGHTHPTRVFAGSGVGTRLTSSYLFGRFNEDEFHINAGDVPGISECLIAYLASRRVERQLDALAASQHQILPFLHTS